MLQKELHLSGFYLRKIEDVVDKRQKVFARAANLLEIGPKSSKFRSMATSCNISE